MAMVPKLRGRSFITPYAERLPDQWALMAAATIQEQDRLFVPNSFEDRVSGAKDAIADGTFDPRGINAMSGFEKMDEVVPKKGKAQ